MAWPRPPELPEGNTTASKRSSESAVSSSAVLTTKAGSVFALCAANGDIDARVSDAHGLFFHDMRYLDRATLRLNGGPLSVLLASADSADRSISEMTNPRLQLASGVPLPKEMLGIRRERRLARTVEEDVTVQNFALHSVQVGLSFEFEACFDDIFVIRGSRRGKRGELREPRWEGSTLCLQYDGADGRSRGLDLNFDPPPSQMGPGEASYDLSLDAHGSTRIRITGELRDLGPGTLESTPLRPPATRYLNRVLIETDNTLFNRVLQRSLDDLQMLLTRQRGETYFAAGVPWFVALFGRDSLVTALEILPLDPRIASNTLRRLAKFQGRRTDPRTLEQPGRILHELRVGEKANLGEVPYTPYYGTVDATPLFIIVLGQYLRWTGDVALWRQLKGNLVRALAWIDQNAGRGSGFTAYATEANLGWKDSANGIVRSDGSLAQAPIALVEAQGFVHWAKLEAARLFDLDGDLETSARLRQEANDLRLRFNRAFWLRDRRYFALALEGERRPVEAISSNPGQALLSGIVSPRHVAAVSRMLMSERLFSGWGVRTLASSEAAYNPIDYQVGAVWPHDNALICAGLKRCGQSQASLRIFSAIYDAAAAFPQFRLPEVFCGFPRAEFVAPVRYPVACSPQAWAAGALPLMLMANLGLEADAIGRELKISDPKLPDWLRVVTVRNLQVGESYVDLRFENMAGATQVVVLNRRGEVTVNVRL